MTASSTIWARLGPQAAPGEVEEDDRVPPDPVLEPSHQQAPLMS